MIIFFAVSFLIYGMASLQFYLAPETDPRMLKSSAPELGTMVFIGLAFLYGAYGIAMRRSIAGRIFGITIVVESAVAAAWQIPLKDAASQTVRLSGAIEGFTCFAILIGLFIAVRRGASIFR